MGGSAQVFHRRDVFIHTMPPHVNRGGDPMDAFELWDRSNALWGSGTRDERRRPF